MKRFDRYVLGYFFSSFALVFFFLIGFYLTIDALGKVDEFVDASGKLPEGMREAVPGYVLRYYLLSVPYFYLQFAPFIALLAILFTGVRMAQSNELVPIVSAGVSLFRAVTPLCLAAAFVGVSMVAVRETVLPRIDDLRDSLRDRLLNQREERVYPSFWVDTGGGEKIRCGKFYPAQVRIEDFTLRSRSEGQKITVNADAATFGTGDRGIGWYLERGVRRVQEADGSERISEFGHIEAAKFTPRDLLVAYRAQDNPIELSFSQISELSLRDPERRDYLTLLHYFLTFPLMALILPLIGLPFVLLFESRSSSEGIAIAFLIFFAYFGVDLYLRNLGNQGALHPLIASWFPVVLFGSLGIILFDSTRT